MTIRCFDRQGRPIPYETLRRLDLTTPAMEHIVAAVAERAGVVMPANNQRRIENDRAT